MAKTREFHLGDVLSITTGYLVSPRHMDGVYDILNFMTGDNLITHQLPRACDEMAPRLLAQHPVLKEVDMATFEKPCWREWLDEQIAKFGETLDVRAEHQFHEVIDPLEELKGKGTEMTEHPALRRFRYRTIGGDGLISAAQLDEFGRDGWELVAMIPNDGLVDAQWRYVLYFKQELIV